MALQKMVRHGIDDGIARDGGIDDQDKRGRQRMRIESPFFSLIDPRGIRLV
jgi:hypothetical protein